MNITHSGVLIRTAYGLSNRNESFFFKNRSGDDTCNDFTSRSDSKSQSRQDMATGITVATIAKTGFIGRIASVEILASPVP